MRINRSRSGISGRSLKKKSQKKNNKNNLDHFWMELKRKKEMKKKCIEKYRSECNSNERCGASVADCIAIDALSIRVE